MAPNLKSFLIIGRSFSSVKGKFAREPFFYDRTNGAEPSPPRSRGETVEVTGLDSDAHPSSTAPFPVHKVERDKADQAEHEQAQENQQELASS